MKNKIRISTLVAILLMSVALLPVANAQEELSNMSDTSDVVSIEQAEKVASYSIKEISESISVFSGWKNATVKLSTVYYDLNGNRSAYSFNVIENKQQTGYIFISARKDNYPVLEFSKGKIPNEILKLRTLSKSLVEARVNKIKLESADKEELTIGEMKPLYLGPTFYYAEYTLTDKKGKTKEKVIVDLPFSTVVDFNKSNVSVSVDENDSYFNNTSLQQQQEIRKQEANAKWESIEERMTLETIPEGYTSTKSIGYIYDVPNYEQYDECPGCSPTASAMVLGYWDANGYPNFPLGLSLVQELANAMGTSNWPNPPGGTWPWDIDDGIEEVCEDHGYTNFDATNDYFLSWSEVTTEVDADRPFVISMLNGGAGSGHSQEYGDHSVTCIGYSDGSQDYVFLHDTWDSEDDHYIAFGSWDGAMATWVRP